jgi:hypothetical protein
MLGDNDILVLLFMDTSTYELASFVSSELWLKGRPSSTP